MILEWLSFRSEFCSRVKFVQILHDKIEQLILRCFACVVFTPDQIRKCHPSQTTWFAIYNLEQRKKFLTRTGVSFGMKTGMNSFWDDLCRNEMSFRYHVNKIRTKKHEDGTNSFQNESHSGFLWEAPKPLTFCISVLIVSHYFIGTCILTYDGHTSPVKSVCWIDIGKC